VAKSMLWRNSGTTDSLGAATSPESRAGGNGSMGPASPRKSGAREIGRERNQSLDCLRAIAVFMVMCRHFRYIPGSGRGWAGVDLFFVLSGFLIGGLLFQQWRNTGGLQIQRFYLRRALKLYPSFYFFIAATAAL
jgi:peptidoglycan/LPS O-acetylase OafA/YrhL